MGCGFAGWSGLSCMGSGWILLGVCVCRMGIGHRGWVCFPFLLLWDWVLFISSWSLVWFGSSGLRSSDGEVSEDTDISSQEGVGLSVVREGVHDMSWLGS